MGFWSNLFNRTPPQEKRAYAARSAHLIGPGLISANSNTIAAFRKVPPLYRVVDKLATSVARSKWRAVVVVPSDPGNPLRTAAAETKAWLQEHASIASARDRRLFVQKALANGRVKEIPSHPMLKLWESGPPEMDATTVRYLIQAYLMVVGEVHVAIGRKNGKDAFIQPFPPHAVDAHTNSVTAKFRLGQRTWEFPRKDVFTIRKPDLGDPYSASLGMAQVLVNELDMYESGSVATSSRFKNGMRPDLLIGVSGLDDAAAERVEKKLAETHGGPHAVGKPLVTDAQTISVEQLNASMVDMDVLNLLNQKSNDVREVPGIPPEIFGQLTNSNRSTIDAADYLYNAHPVDGALWFLGAALNHHLGKRFDGDAILVYDSPIPEDREFKAQVYQEHPGSFTKDEKRALADEQPMDGGDAVQGTSYTAGQVQSMSKIVADVAAKVISRESGIALLVNAFSLSKARAEEMMGPENFVAATPPAGPGKPGDGFQQDESDDPRDEEQPDADGTTNPDKND